MADQHLPRHPPWRRDRSCNKIETGPPDRGRPGGLPLPLRRLEAQVVGTLEAEHDQRQPRARHRHPEQRTLCRPPHLEPADLRQGPGHGEATLEAQFRERVAGRRGARPAHRRRRTLGRGEGTAGHAGASSGEGRGRPTATGSRRGRPCGGGSTCCRGYCIVVSAAGGWPSPVRASTRPITAPRPRRRAPASARASAASGRASPCPRCCRPCGTT